MKNNLKNNQEGVAIFLMVVILGAAALIIALNASSLGIGQLTTSYADSKGQETFSIADGCMDEALERIRKSPSYGLGGPLNLNLGDGSCIITVSDLGGGQRKINILSTINSYNSKIEADVDTTGSVVTIISWDELTN